MGSVVTFLSGLFVAIANVKALAEYANTFAANVMAWYLSTARAEQKTAIADATALAASAETDEEFFAASKALQKAMSMNRVMP